MSAVDEYRKGSRSRHLEASWALEQEADSAIAELEASVGQLRRDDEMLRRALTNMASWEVDDILDRYPDARGKS